LNRRPDYVQRDQHLSDSLGSVLDSTEQTLEKCRSVVAASGSKKKFRFKNKLVSLDSSTIDLCMSVFDWAKFRRTKGAVKLHLLLDHDGYLPSYAVITDSKKSDIRVA
jgi:hypothetical protein